MESVVRQRIVLLFSNNGISINSLSKGDKALQRKMNRQINEGAAITCETISSILEAFPNISAEWLLRGEGEMLRGNDNALDNDTLKKEIVLYVDENGFLKIKK